MIRSTVLSKYLGTWVQVPVFAGSCSISQGAITSCFTVPGPSRPLSSKATASKLSVSGFLQAPHGFAVVGASAERQKFGNKAPPRSARSAGTLSRHLLLCSVERWRSSSLRRPSGPTLLPSARPLCRACEPHTDGHRRRGRLGRFVGDDKRQKAGEMVGNIVFVMLGLG